MEIARNSVFVAPTETRGEHYRPRTRVGTNGVRPSQNGFVYGSLETKLADVTYEMPDGKGLSSPDPTDTPLAGPETSEKGHYSDQHDKHSPMRR